MCSDGVGGWADEGVDPGLFSRALAKATAGAIVEQQSVPIGSSERGEASEGGAGGVELQEALAAGLSRVRGIGTSTACLVHVHRDGTLKARAGAGAKASQIRRHRNARPRKPAGRGWALDPPPPDARHRPA